MPAVCSSAGVTFENLVVFTKDRLLIVDRHELRKVEHDIVEAKTQQSFRKECFSLLL